MPAVPRGARTLAQHSVVKTAERDSTGLRRGYSVVWRRVLGGLVLDHGRWVGRGGEVEARRHFDSLDVGFRCRGLGKEVRDGARRVRGCLRGAGV